MEVGELRRRREAHRDPEATPQRRRRKTPAPAMRDQVQMANWQRSQVPVPPSARGRILASRDPQRARTPGPRPPTPTTTLEPIAGYRHLPRRKKVHCVQGLQEAGFSDEIIESAMATLGVRARRTPSDQTKQQKGCLNQRSSIVITNQQRFRTLRKRITTASLFGGAAGLPTVGSCVAVGHSNRLGDTPYRRGLPHGRIWCQVFHRRRVADLGRLTPPARHRGPR